MRVAMGLALNEVEREARAIEFYNVLSTFDFMSSTPTLFNSGTHRSQLSSCYLTTVVGRPRRHLRSDQGERAAVEVRRRARQRLDQRARDGLAHQGHQRQVAGRRAVPEGGERHGGGGESVLRARHAGAHGARRAADPRRAAPAIWCSARAASIARCSSATSTTSTMPMVAIDVKHSVEPIEVTDAHPFWALAACRWAIGEARRALRSQGQGRRPRGSMPAACRPGDYVGFTDSDRSRAGRRADRRRRAPVRHPARRRSPVEGWPAVGRRPAIRRRDAHLEFVRDYLCGARHPLSGRPAAARRTCKCTGRARRGRRARRDNRPHRGDRRGDAAVRLRRPLRRRQHRKRIAPRFAHLPRPQTLALVRGLLEADGAA